MVTWSVPEIIRGLHLWIPWIDCGKVNVIFSETGGLGDKLERICSHQVYAGELGQEWGLQDCQSPWCTVWTPTHPSPTVAISSKWIHKWPWKPSYTAGPSINHILECTEKFLYYEFLLVGFCIGHPLPTG